MHQNRLGLNAVLEGKSAKGKTRRDETELDVRGAHGSAKNRGDQNPPVKHGSASGPALLNPTGLTFHPVM